MYILALAWWRQGDIISITKWCWMDIILIASDFSGGSFNWTKGSKLRPFMVSSRFNPNFLGLSNPISYLLSESLSSLWHFLDLREAFLRDFSSLSNFLFNWTNNCLAELGFLPAFLAAQLAFTVPSFLYLQQSLVACVVCTPPCFLHSLQDILKQTFLGAFFVAPVLGRLFPATLFWEAFLPDCTWAFSCVHMRMIALRDTSRECMSMGVIPFL